MTPEAARPVLAQGLMTGDVLYDRAIVWSRSDRPARLWVEWALDPTFRRAQRLRGPHALAGYQFFGQVDIDARSEAMTMSLVDTLGTTLFAQTLEPQR